MTEPSRLCRTEHEHGWVRGALEAGHGRLVLARPRHWRDDEVDELLWSWFKWRELDAYLAAKRSRMLAGSRARSDHHGTTQIWPDVDERAA